MGKYKLREYAPNPLVAHVTLHRYQVDTKGVSFKNELVAPDISTQVTLSKDDCHCNVVLLVVYPDNTNRSAILGQSDVVADTIPASGTPVQGVGFTLTVW